MKEPTPKISVIVPVYNAGERLEKCLQTLVNQTLREIEIILVLDCPTDGSDKIAKKYAEQDKRIIIVENQRNLHIGESRNQGLATARGEYIGFSDHDDYRDHTMYETLYRQAISNDADVVLGKLIEVGSRNAESSYPEIKKETLKEFLLEDMLVDGNDITFTPYAVNITPNLYRADFLTKHNICFVDTKTYTPEDRIFQTICLHHARNITVNNDSFYFHTTHDNNTAESIEYSHYLVIAKGKELIHDFLVQNNCYEKYKPFFLKGVKKTFTDALLNELFHTLNIKKTIEAVRFTKSLSFTKDAFRNSRYSLERYRFFGKLNRRIVFLLMKF